MERLTEKIVEKDTKKVLAYRTKCGKEIESIQKLGVLEDLEEKGRLLELPCAVGDTVYYPFIDSNGEPGIEEIMVIDVSSKRYQSHDGNWNFLDEIGDEVFTTRKEAEAALQKLNREPS